MDRVLITGGAGFIGSRLASKLVGTYEVAILDSFLQQVHGDGGAATSNIPREVHITRADVRDYEAVARLVSGFDPHIVFHLAAETGTGQSFDQPTRYNSVNVIGTCNLIEASRAHGKSLRRVVLSGSRSIYGEGACVDEDDQSTVAQERTADDLKSGIYAPRDVRGRLLRPVSTNFLCPPSPASVYASTKLMQEYLLRQAFWGTKVGVGILRLQNVYGPGQSLRNPYTGVMSIFFSQIEQGHKLNIFEDGQITRDFVFVDDVVSAFEAIGAVDALPAVPIDIGSGVPTTILDMARHMMGTLGGDLARIEVTGDFRPGDVRYAVADIAAAKEMLGWHPTVSFATGADKFIDWASANL